MDGKITRRTFTGGLASVGMIAWARSACAALRGFDHIVINFPDLDSAIRNYTDLGFTVVRGGSNPLGTTHNALIALADGAYIEMTAFDGPNRSTSGGMSRKRAAASSISACRPTI
jgi:catechol 2,3-dioxygenase-like lactoylglutathione lyase family enzyme